jgi:hypothetical protein
MICQHVKNAIDEDSKKELRLAWSRHNVETSCQNWELIILIILTREKKGLQPEEHLSQRRR